MKAWLFDLDGTLADTIEDIAASVDAVRARFGLSAIGVEAVRPMVGDGLGALLRRALSRGGVALSEKDLEMAGEFYVSHHEAQCTRTVRLYPGVRDFLERLAGAGHPLAVVTNKPLRFARAIARHLRLDDLIPVVIGGDSLPQRKPDPAPLLCALQRLGVLDRQGTMVGDSPGDIAAGRAAGLETIACLYGYRPAEALIASGPDRFWRRFGGDD
ncbi:MAG: hypothetical protein Fur0037_11980 [Planctomycetota bacterium]